MAPPPRFRIIILILSLIFTFTVLADTPSDNDIPTLAIRILGSNLFAEDITLELLCELSWLSFDAVGFSGRASNTKFKNLMSICDSAGVYYSICPGEVMQYVHPWGDSTFSSWFRNSNDSLTSNNCFAQCDEDYTSLINSATAEAMYEDSSYSIKTTVIDGLAVSTFGHDFLWFYEVYDEANTQQGQNALKNEAPWDDYIPNVYTQARDSTGDTLTLAEVETSGIFSIQKYYAENNEQNEVTLTMNFALLHTIDTTDYTGLKLNIGWTNMVTQAICVRAMMEAEYQPPPSGDTIHLPEDNRPLFICFDYYPFRQVNPQAAMEDSIPAKMCDDDWLFLIEHFEEGIDSTTIPAHEYNRPVYYFPQTFGVAGGSVMYTDSILDYNSYMHRKPAPQEFRMLCNLALLHQAKGIFPYNLTSYLEPYGPGQTPERIMSSLLDLHNIPFDAPYEEWVYTGRWPNSTFEYVRPDSLPPWIDGYDPLYDVSDPPDTTGSVQKRYEIWFEWLCEPYAELYNNLGGILADVKWIGPEMYDLWWWEENGTAYWDVAQITVPDSEFVENYVSPRIRVFRKEGNDYTYLFYVNRYCGDYYTGEGDGMPVHISIQGTQFPGDLSEDALDHSRLCLVPVEKGQRDWYFFDDTLAAGESRLLEFVDLSPPTQADLRITSPDVFCSFINADVRIPELCCKAGESIELGATFYNMGTSATGNVMVNFIDHSGVNPVIIGSDVISLGGLSQDYEPDSTSAVVTWNTDSCDIGVHVIEISANTISGEDSLDNTVSVTVLVEPRDYATEVRGDSWDMDYDSTSTWYTGDIEAIDMNWDTTSTGWTDSVSGMFEGVINYDYSTNWFKGDISLTIPVDSEYYIDTDKYHMLSFGITVNNPNRLDDNACAMHIKWIDSHNNAHGWLNLLSETDYHVGNGWDRWSIIGPIDLNDIDTLRWGDDDAKELWIRLQTEIILQPEPLDTLPLDIRIGWIRLEESTQ